MRSALQSHDLDRSVTVDPRDACAALVMRWPGPAALLAPDGEVRHANTAMRPLLAVLAEQPGALLALAGVRAAKVLEPITVAGSPNPHVYELTVVPGDDGALLTARDVSLPTNLRSALAESRRRYKDLVEISSDFAWETNSAGAFVFVSPHGALGYTADELIGREASFLLAEADEVHAQNSPFIAHQRIEGQEIWVKRADRQSARVSISALPLTDNAGAYSGTRGLCRDVTASFLREAALAEAQNHERLLAYITRTIRDEVEADAMLGTAAATMARALGGAGASIWRRQTDGRFHAASRFGLVPPADLDPEPALAKASASAPDAPIAIESGTGRMIAFITHYRRVVNGAIAVWRAPDRPDWSAADRAVIADVAGQLGIALSQLAQHEALSQLARTDAMTGLLNRRTFVKEVATRLIHARRTRRTSALLYVDLDNFKPVNDQFGHQRGDEALKMVAAWLSRTSRAGDLVARLGGDEFALWVEESDLAGAVAKAQALTTRNEELTAFSGDPARPLGLSVGIAFHRPERPEPVDELIARADAAMYNAKRTGKGRFVVAPPDHEGDA